MYVKMSKWKETEREMNRWVVVIWSLNQTTVNRRSI